MDCKCFHPPFDDRDYETTYIGIDETNGRYGTVSIDTCRQCGTQWLCYSVEYEAFKRSGRWYRGIFSPTSVPVVPSNVPEMLETLEWYFFGGSYFRSTGEKGKGKLSIDV